MKLNDVFCWSYKDEHLPQHDPYWCKSRIAVLGEDGVLRDTYWTGQDNYVVVQDQVQLTFLGNLDDYDESTYRHPEHWYIPENILDLRHPNGGKVYVRKGAKVDREVRMDYLTTKVQIAEESLELTKLDLATFESEAAT